MDYYWFISQLSASCANYYVGDVYDPHWSVIDWSCSDDMFIVFGIKKVKE